MIERDYMRILKQPTRYVFYDSDANDLSILTRLVSANGISYLYKNNKEKWAACPIGLEKYIAKKYHPSLIKNDPNPWQASKLSVTESKIQPRDRLQKDAMKFIIDNSKSTYIAIIVPPGIGKTVLGIMAAIKYGERTLIICPNTNIKAQWMDTLLNMFQIPKQKVLDADSPMKLKTANQDFIICIQQPLASLAESGELEDVLKKLKIGTKITDEAHMFFKNNIAIESSSNIRHNILLTATFTRTNDEESRLFDVIYSKVKRLTITADDLEKYDINKHVNIVAVELNSKLSLEQIRAMTTSAQVGNKYIVTLNIGRYTASTFPNQGVTTYMKQFINVIRIFRNKITYGKMLILVPTIQAVDRVAGILKQIYPDKAIGTLHSKNSKSANNYAKKEANIIVSTIKSAGTGVDIKNLSMMIVGEQFRSKILSNQASGRLRPYFETLKNGEKIQRDTYYVDICDKRITQLRSWRDDRLIELKKKAKSYQVLNPNV
jgi:superfamily II DNA or RNA helicase